MHFTLRTFKLGREPPKQRGALFYTYDAALRNTNANHYTHSKPKPHQGHTITTTADKNQQILLLCGMEYQEMTVTIQVPKSIIRNGDLLNG